MTTSVILLLLATNLATTISKQTPPPDLGLVRPTLQPEIIPIPGHAECEDECFGLRVCRASHCGEKAYRKCMGKCKAAIEDPDTDYSHGLILPPCISELYNSDAGFEPQCTEEGNYKPQQCLKERQEFDMIRPPQCQCVNTVTGEEIQGTKTECWSDDCHNKFDCNKFQVSLKKEGEACGFEYNPLLQQMSPFEECEEGLICVGGGLVDSSSMRCKKLDCGANEEFTKCADGCHPYCVDGSKIQPEFCIMGCGPGCTCRNGYIMDTSSGECIPEEECPGEPGQTLHKEGESCGYCFGECDGLGCESGLECVYNPRLPDAPGTCKKTGPCRKLLQTAKFAPGAEPKCTESGDFVPQKCQLILSGAWTSKFCWCQDPKTGDEIKGTRRGPGEINVDCETYHPEDHIEVIEVIEDTKPSTGLTFPPCIDQRMTAEAEAQKKDINGFEFALEVGPFIPKCSNSGDFEPRQCHKDGKCWCVNIKTGNEIPGTRYGAEEIPPVECTAIADSCGANEEYTMCGSACAPYCLDGSRIQGGGICMAVCVEGCVCGAGFIHDKNKDECIPEEDCPAKPEDGVELKIPKRKTKCISEDGRTFNDGDEWTEPAPAEAYGSEQDCYCNAPFISCGYAIA